MIQNIKIGTLEYLTAETITTPHCFTTRLGGVSQGDLASMNLAVSRGDSQENVVKNFEILGNVLGFSPEDVVMTKQTHTDIVRTVTACDRGTGLLKPGFPDCDALITNDPGVVLVVFTADCTPILFHDPVTGAVGAAHAGWRGTAADIAGKTVEAMVCQFGCRPEDIRCAIGPHLGACCLETDADVPPAMLAAINALFFKRRGIRHIDCSDECTVCHVARFWSHRRVGQRRGSQGAIIQCKEV